MVNYLDFEDNNSLGNGYGDPSIFEALQTGSGIGCSEEGLICVGNGFSFRYWDDSWVVTLSYS